MNEVVIDVIANPDEAVEGLGNVEEILQNIQKEADALSRNSTELLNVHGLQRSIGSVGKMNQGLRTMQVGMQLAGVQGGALGNVMRALAMANMAGASSAGAMSKMLLGLTAQVKAFMVAIGPVGWAIMAVGAAATVASRAFAAQREEVGKLADAIVRTIELSGDYYSRVRNLEIELLQAQEKTYEATMALAREEYYERSDIARRSKEERLEMLEKEKVDQETHNARMIEIEEQYQKEVNLTRELYNARRKKAIEERNKAEQEANQQMEANINRAREMVNAIENEIWAVGRSKSEIVARELALMGLSEAEAEAAGALAERLEKMREEHRNNEQHSQTITRMNLELEYNTAALYENVEAMREVSIQKAMLAGLTRQQAEEQVNLTEKIKESAEALALANRDKQEEIDLQEKLNQAQQIGLLQLYEKIQAGALTETEENMMPTATTAAASKSDFEIEKSTSKASEFLEKIYNLLDEFRSSNGLVGVAG